MTASVVSCPGPGSAPSNSPMVRKPSFSSGSPGSGMRSSPSSCCAIMADARFPGSAQPVPGSCQADGARWYRKGARMNAVGALLGLALLTFELILVARVVLDWVGALAPGGTGARLRARGGTHAVTEPVIAPVRRVLRPVRLGP